MKINRISAIEYKQLFPHPFSLFNSVDFAELNREKCISLHYLIFVDKKVRLGIVLGETDSYLKTPFSATYGGFSNNTNVPLEYYDEACVRLKEYGESTGKKIIITLAPPLYDKLNTSKTLIALIRAGASIKSVDYNHHFELVRFKDYNTMLNSKTRNKLNGALSSGLSFQKLDSKNKTDVERAYNVIKRNHKERGNPLHMSLQNVWDTINIIPADFFVVTNPDNIDVASAQIFHTSKEVYQIVYWGDDPRYSYLKSMNFLAYKLFEYYYERGVKILDIGISTEEGVPNYGLCEFKENIGCSSSNRFSFIL